MRHEYKFIIKKKNADEEQLWLKHNSIISSWRRDGTLIEKSRLSTNNRQRRGHERRRQTRRLHYVDVHFLLRSARTSHVHTRDKSSCAWMSHCGADAKLRQRKSEEEEEEETFSLTFIEKSESVHQPKPSLTIRPSIKAKVDSGKSCSEVFPPSKSVFQNITHSFSQTPINPAHSVLALFFFCPTLRRRRRRSFSFWRSLKLHHSTQFSQVMRIYRN